MIQKQPPEFFYKKASGLQLYLKGDSKVSPVNFAKFLITTFL